MFRPEICLLSSCIPTSRSPSPVPGTPPPRRVSSYRYRFLWSILCKGSGASWSWSTELDASSANLRNFQKLIPPNSLKLLLWNSWPAIRKEEVALMHLGIWYWTVQFSYICMWNFESWWLVTFAFQDTKGNHAASGPPADPAGVMSAGCVVPASRGSLRLQQAWQGSSSSFYRHDRRRPKSI